MFLRPDQLTRRHALLLTIALLACSPWSASAGDSDPARVLAPTGKLRVGLYPGTPTSIVNNHEKPPRGVGYDIGQELARRLHVDYEPVVFGKNAEVLQAVASGAVDVVFTNATAARAKDMDFGTAL